MVTIEAFRKLALPFPEATEEPHFEKISFRVKKKIFATYDETLKRASLKLSETDQDIFHTADESNIYPVANKWGRQGWTVVELMKVRKELFDAALKHAYVGVAPKKLADEVANTLR